MEENKGGLILIGILCLGLLVWGIISAINNGQDTAATGQIVIILGGIICGYILANNINKNRESKGLGLIVGLIVAIGCIALSQTDAAFYIGLITLIVGTIAVWGYIFSQNR